MFIDTLLEHLILLFVFCRGNCWDSSLTHRLIHSVSRSCIYFSMHSVIHTLIHSLIALVTRVTLVTIITLITLITVTTLITIIGLISLITGPAPRFLDSKEGHQGIRCEQFLWGCCEAALRQLLWGAMFERCEQIVWGADRMCNVSCTEWKKYDVSDKTKTHGITTGKRFLLCFLRKLLNSN